MNKIKWRKLTGKYHKCEEVEYKDCFFRAGIIKDNKEVPNDVIYFEIVSKGKKKAKDDIRLDFTVNEALAFQLALAGTLWAYDTMQRDKREGKKDKATANSYKKRGVSIK